MIARFWVIRCKNLGGKNESYFRKEDRNDSGLY